MQKGFGKKSDKFSHSAKKHQRVFPQPLQAQKRSLVLDANLSCHREKNLRQS